MLNSSRVEVMGLKLSQEKATGRKHVFIFKGQYMGLVLLYIYIYISTSPRSPLIPSRVFTVRHCASLCVTVRHCASLCVTVCQCVSLCVTVCHCVSLCTYRNLIISLWQRAMSAIRRKNDCKSLPSKRAGKKMQKSRFSLSEAHGCRHMSTYFSVLL